MEYSEYFDRIAPHLGNPLVLVGFVLLLFFGIHRALIGSKILPPVSKRASGQIVRLLLHYGLSIALITIVAGFAFAFWKAQVESKTDVLTRVDAEAIIQKNRGNIERCLKRLEKRFFFLDFYISHDADAGINIDIAPFYKHPQDDSGIVHPRIYVDEAKQYEGETAVVEHQRRSTEQKLSITSPDANLCILDSLKEDIRRFQLPLGRAFIHRYITDACCGV